MMHPDDEEEQDALWGLHARGEALQVAIDRRCARLRIEERDPQSEPMIERREIAILQRVIRFLTDEDVPPNLNPQPYEDDLENL